MSRPIAVVLLLFAALLVFSAECHRQRGGSRWAQQKERYEDDDDKPKEARWRDSAEDTDGADDDEVTFQAAWDDKFQDARQPAKKRLHGWHRRNFTSRRQHGLSAWLSEILDEGSSKDDDDGSQGDMGADSDHRSTDTSTSRHDVRADARSRSWHSSHVIKMGKKTLGRINWHEFLGLTPPPSAAYLSNRSRGSWYQGSNVCRSVTGQLPEGDDDDSDASKETAGGTRFRHGKHVKSVTCFERANERTCHTNIIDFEGKKYEQVKVERCCSGYTIMANKCVADEKAESLTAAMRKQGAATFASILEELDMPPAAHAEGTVFAPTDRALEEHFTMQGLNVTAVIVNPRHKNIAVAMKELLQAHRLLGSKQMGSTLENQLLKTMHPHPNASLRVNVYEQAYRKPMVNCVPLVKTDIATKNGLLNIVERMLLPVTESLTSKLNSDARLTRFTAALKKAFGDNLWSLDGSEGPMTIFAPNNEAMDEFEKLTKDGMGGPCLLRLLRQHIVANVICTGVVGHRARAFSITGRETLLERQQQTIMVAGMSRIMEGDIMATNGVIHVIDKVIFDNDNAVDLEQKMTTGNLLGFLKLMDRFGVNAKEISNVTVLVPPTAALQQIIEQKLGVEGRYDEAALVNYHIVPGQLSCDAFRGGPTQTTHGVPLMLQTYALFPLLGNIHTANCVRVVKKNTLTCNGIIHELEKVLEPPSKTIYQTIRSTAGLEQFARLLEQTTFKEKLDVLTDDMFTVYSPNNAAMNQVESMTVVEKEKFVAKHVAPGYKCCAGVPELFSTYIDMVGPHRIWLTKEMPSGTITIKGGPKVVQCDLVSTNGVIHVIDQAMGTRSQPFGFDRFVLPVSLFPSRGFGQP